MVAKQTECRAALRPIAAAFLLLCATGWAILGAAPRQEAGALHDLRQQKVDAAKDWYETTRVAYSAGTVILDEVYSSSIALKNASLEMADGKQARIDALKTHCDRMQAITDEVERHYQANARGGEVPKRTATRYWLAEAKVWSAEEEAKP